MVSAYTLPVTEPPSSGSRAWAGVVSLGLGIFAIVVPEFLPASLLPRIAGDLRVTLGQAGQAVSVTAFAGAASALLIAAVLPRADRRRVMIGLTLLAAISDAAVAFAPNLAVLLAARLLLGVALGGFGAMAAAMASYLVHPHHVGRALTVINSGVSLARVAAIPLGTWLGEVWGWRAVFLLGAGFAGLVGTILSGPLADRTPRAGVLLFPAVLGVGMLVMVLTGGSTVGLFLAVGAATGGVLVDGVTASAPLLVGGLASVAGAVVLVSLRDQRRSTRSTRAA